MATATKLDYNARNEISESIEAGYNNWRDGVVQSFFQSLLEIGPASFGKGFLALALLGVAAPAALLGLGALLTGAAVSTGAATGLAAGINFVFSGAGFASAVGAGTLLAGVNAKSDQLTKQAIIDAAAARRAEEAAKAAKPVEKPKGEELHMPRQENPTPPVHGTAPAQDLGANPAAGEAPKKKFADMHTPKTREVPKRNMEEIEHLNKILASRNSGESAGRMCGA